MSYYGHKKERNEEMLYLYIDNRLTLDEIGTIYGVSKQRVEQILTKYEVYKTQKLRSKNRIENKRILASLKKFRESYSTGKRFWSYIDKQEKDKCWEWTGSRNNVSGYGRFTSAILEKEYELGCPDYAHRIMWCVWNGKKIPSGKWVLHTCDNAVCVNPHHLYLGSPKDNTQDRKERSGWTGFTRKLSGEEVENIRNIFDRKGISCVENLANVYGVTTSYIYLIGRGLDTRHSPPHGFVKG